MLGCSQSAISLYESGARGRAPRPHIRRRIEAMFGLPAEHVLAPENEDGTGPKADPVKSTITTTEGQDESYHRN